MFTRIDFEIKRSYQKFNNLLENLHTAQTNPNHQKWTDIQDHLQQFQEHQLQVLMILRKNDFNFESLGEDFLKLVFGYLQAQLRFIRLFSDFEIEDNLINMHKIRKNTSIFIMNMILHLCNMPRLKLINENSTKFPITLIHSDSPEILISHQQKLEEQLFSNRDSPQANWDYNTIERIYLSAFEARSMDTSPAGLDQYAPMVPVCEDVLKRFADEVFQEGADLETRKLAMIAKLLEIYNRVVSLMDTFFPNYSLELYLTELTHVNSVDFAILHRLRYSPNLVQTITSNMKFLLFSFSYSFDHLFFVAKRFRCLEFFQQLILIVPSIVRIIENHKLENSPSKPNLDLDSIFWMVEVACKMIINRTPTTEIIKMIESENELVEVRIKNPENFADFQNLFDTNGTLLLEVLFEEMYIFLDKVRGFSKEDEMSKWLTRFFEEIMIQDSNYMSLKQLLIFKKLSRGQLLKNQNLLMSILMEQVMNKFEEVYRIRDIRFFFDFYNLVSVIIFSAKQEHSGSILRFLTKFGGSLLQKKDEIGQWESYFQNFFILVIQVFNRRHLVADLDQATLVKLGQMCRMLFAENPRFKLFDKELLLANLKFMNIDHESRGLLLFILTKTIQMPLVSVLTKQYILNILEKFHFYETLELENVFVTEPLLKKLEANIGRSVSKELYQNLILLLLRKINNNEDVSQLVKAFLTLRPQISFSEESGNLTSEIILQSSMFQIIANHKEYLQKLYSHTLSTNFDLKPQIKSFIMKDFQNMIRNLSLWIMNKSFINNNLLTFSKMISANRGRFFSEIECWRISSQILFSQFNILKNANIIFMQNNIIMFYTTYFNSSFELFHHSDPAIRSQFLECLAESPLVRQDLLPLPPDAPSTQLMDVVGFQELFNIHLNLEPYMKVEMISGDMNMQMNLVKSNYSFLAWLIKFVHTDHFDFNQVFPVLQKNVQILCSLQVDFCIIFAFYLHLMVEYMTLESNSDTQQVFDSMLEKLTQLGNKGTRLT